MEKVDYKILSAEKISNQEMISLLEAECFESDTRIVSSLKFQ